MQIATVFLPAVAAFVRLEAADLHPCEIVFQVIGEDRFNVAFQVPLIAFHRQNVIALSSHDLLGDLLLAPHRVDRDNRPFYVD